MKLFLSASLVLPAVMLVGCSSSGSTTSLKSDVQKTESFFSRAAFDGQPELVDA